MFFVIDALQSTIYDGIKFLRIKIIHIILVSNAASMMLLPGNEKRRSAHQKKCKIG
jgi:hypothetical protein